MEDDNKPAIQELVRQRRSLLNRIRGTEAKLHRLRKRLNLVEVKLACFGHDLEKLRKARQPEKLFKGRSIIRRIHDVQREAGRQMKPKELTDILAAQDGLNVGKWFVRVSGKRRVKAAMQRARRTDRQSLG